jgi:hypothetical protein
VTRDRSVGSCPHLLEQGHSVEDCHSPGCKTLAAAIVLRRQRAADAPPPALTPPTEDEVDRSLNSHAADRHIRSWHHIAGIPLAIFGGKQFGGHYWEVTMLNGEHVTLYTPREAQLFCYGMATAAQAVTPAIPVADDDALNREEGLKGR